MSPASPTDARRHRDWSGFGSAALSRLYAVLVLLVLVLPINGIAYFLSIATNGGSALEGIGYALSHHVVGWYVVSVGHPTSVWAVAWWAEAVWESLFWVGCACALMLFALWVGRTVLLRSMPGLILRHMLR